jgi:beta-lactamase class A
MNRRNFHRHGLALLAAPLPAHARSPSGGLSATLWQSLERRSEGRLGAAVLDARTGSLIGHRLDERFPMCSTFKWLAAALVLHRVGAGEEQLDRRIRYGTDRLLPHSPITAGHVGDGMTLAALCDAAVTVSDNAAANLILESFGGPAAVTAYARRLGDTATRLDRSEPDQRRRRVLDALGCSDRRRRLLDRVERFRGGPQWRDRGRRPGRDWTLNREPFGPFRTGVL